MKKIIITTLFILLCFQLSLGQDFQKTGTTGFVFLELPVTARAVGLGETGITMIDAGAEGLYVNPALIALYDGTMSLNVSYSEWYVETTHQALGVIYNLGLFGTVGLQAIYFDFGEIEKTVNPTAEQTGSYLNLGTYTAGAYALGVSYARSLTDKFSFGASLKYIREMIDEYSADNVIMDIGFLYQTGFKSLRIGSFLQNFGLEAKYANEKFKMPQQLRMGLSAELYGQLGSPNRVTVLAEAVHPNDTNEHLHLGLETELLNTIIVRSGYKFGYDFENLCLGAGLKFQFQGNQIQTDFSYMNHEYLDTTVRYSLGIKF